MADFQKNSLFVHGSTAGSPQLLVEGRSRAIRLENGPNFQERWPDPLNAVASSENGGHSWVRGSQNGPKSPQRNNEICTGQPLRLEAALARRIEELSCV